MLKTVRGELKEMPSRAQDARLTMAYLVFGCHLLSQSLQAISHLYDTNTQKRYCYKLGLLYEHVCFLLEQMTITGKSGAEGIHERKEAYE